MDNVLSVFSSGHTALAVFAVIVIFELKFSLRLSPIVKQRIREITLISLGCYFILFHQHVIFDDIFIDMRGVGIALATLFGGVRLGIVAIFAELAVRIWIGGSSVLANSVGLVIDLLLSVLVLQLFVVDRDRIKLQQIALVGVMVGLSEAIALLFITPFSQGWSLFCDFGIDLFLIQLLGVLLFGWLLKNQDDRMRGREHGKARIQKLNETLRLSVSALSTAMAHHDLSTAGHEQRVGDLAVKVGKVLGMNADQLEGLYLASMVHDVGQIRVPREILSRPRKLSPEEFEMIKLHVEAGYQILKSIPFPWPIADIVRQHHEHVDGTGYPNGLTGDSMLIEAKILHVCDALEAMTSHRPFRRAYSNELALEDLNRYKSTRYDAQVVEICERLFTQEGYVFPTYKQEIVL